MARPSAAEIILRSTQLFQGRTSGEILGAGIASAGESLSKGLLGLSEGLQRQREKAKQERDQKRIKGVLTHPNLGFNDLLAALGEMESPEGRTTLANVIGLRLQQKRLEAEESRAERSQAAAEENLGLQRQKFADTKKRGEEGLKLQRQREARLAREAKVEEERKATTFRQSIEDRQAKSIAQHALSIYRPEMRDQPSLGEAQQVLANLLLTNSRYQDVPASVKAQASAMLDDLVEGVISSRLDLKAKRQGVVGTPEHQAAVDEAARRAEDEAAARTRGEESVRGKVRAEEEARRAEEKRIDTLRKDSDKALDYAQSLVKQLREGDLSIANINTAANAVFNIGALDLSKDPDLQALAASLKGSLQDRLQEANTNPVAKSALMHDVVLTWAGWLRDLAKQLREVDRAKSDTLARMASSLLHNLPGRER